MTWLEFVVTMTRIIVIFSFYPRHLPAEGVISYSGEQGHGRGLELLLQDVNFDGVATDGHIHGGLGQLTDGQIGKNNFRLDLGHGKGMCGRCK